MFQAAADGAQDFAKVVHKYNSNSTSSFRKLSLMWVLSDLFSYWTKSYLGLSIVFVQYFMKIGNIITTLM